DPASPFVTSGIRIGLTSVSQRGLGEPEIKLIADIMARVARDPENEEVLARCRAEAQEMIAKFPLYPEGSFDD
ncbi:MAG: serine hydroxymethyltransferase, partial [Eubacterium pyruvativorans]|nr:serine hydroxymethyltransferase [Eubacterium pyruvativorans]